MNPVHPVPWSHISNLDLGHAACSIATVGAVCAQRPRCPTPVPIPWSAHRTNHPAWRVHRYVRAVRAVTEEYGGLLPDSVFVISTFDRPQVIMAGRLKATTADARAGALAAAATAVDATGAGGGAPGGGPHSHGDPAVVPPPPVMRFCTSHAFADIAVPSPHFYMKNYSGLLSQVRSGGRCMCHV